MTAAVLNDVHSGLNATEVAEYLPVDSPRAVQDALARARSGGFEVAVAGGRHAMGGQQLRTGGMVLDTGPLSGVLALDAKRGLVEVAAGTTWPDLMNFLADQAARGGPSWAVAQKQSGVDRVTVGGSISANSHGRGLAMPPFVADVESLVLVAADGRTLGCSREENAEVFALAIGGYGLFGVIVAVTLRLVPRRTLERWAAEVAVARIAPEVHERRAAGWTYGNAALDTAAGETFLRRAVLTLHRPVQAPVPVSSAPADPAEWEHLLLLAHQDKAGAFEALLQRELSLAGTLEGPDAHHLGEYGEGYHGRIDAALGSPVPGSELSAEVYVPPARLEGFLEAAATDLAATGVDVIYANVRFARADRESFLPWAAGDVACVVFAIHTDRTDEELDRSEAAVRRLIDLAIAAGGSYFLTYHRHATRKQVEAAHPRFRVFLAAKEEHDPEGVLVSDWLVHHRALLGLDR